MGWDLPMQLGFRAGELAQMVGGSLLRGTQEAPIQRISTDTRTLKPGDLFIPLIGEHFDGHSFLHEAEAKGARGAIVSCDVASGLPILIRVPDTLVALGTMASHHRQRFSIPVVAITGSNGKTTTRAMLVSILSQHGSVLSPVKSYNNRIGVPLTLLELQSGHHRAVLELGTNHPGEIRLLAEMTHPTIGVITNVGPTHLAGLGTVEGVAAEKASLLEFAQDAVLNADNPHTAAMASKVQGTCLRFGIQCPAEVKARSIQQITDPSYPSGQSASLNFTLEFGAEQIPIALPVLGTHNVSNALAAASAALLLGCSLQEIKAGLESYTPVSMRVQLQHVGGITFLNDAYNANPVSMQAALDLIAQMSAEGRKIMVLGDMLELGSESQRFHREMGEYVQQAHPDLLMTVGDQAAEIAAGAIEAGMPATDIHVMDSTEEAADFLTQQLEPGDLVLLKASRAMRFEEILQGGPSVPDCPQRCSE